MTGKAPARSCEDLDSTALSYAEVKALAAGNPLIKERMELDMAVSKLKALLRSFEQETYQIEERVAKTLPQSIAEAQQRIINLTADIDVLQRHTLSDQFKMTVAERTFTEKSDAAEFLLSCCLDADPALSSIISGSYRGLAFEVKQGLIFSETPWNITFRGSGSYSAELGKSAAGNLTRIDNLLDRLPELLTQQQGCLEVNQKRLQDAKQELGRVWPRTGELTEKAARLIEVDALLDAAAEQKLVPEQQKETRSRDGAER